MRFRYSVDLIQQRQQQLRGHSSLNLYLHGIEHHPTGLCDWCNVPENLVHVFALCPPYDEPRSRLLHSVHVMGITWQASRM